MTPKLFKYPPTLTDRLAEHDAELFLRTAGDDVFPLTLPAVADDYWQKARTAHPSIVRSRTSRDRYVRMFMRAVGFLRRTTPRPDAYDLDLARSAGEFDAYEELDRPHRPAHEPPEAFAARTWSRAAFLHQLLDHPATRTAYIRAFLTTTLPTAALQAA